LLRTLVSAQNSRDGKEPEPSNNEPNQNPGFAKNRTEPEPESKECARTRTEPNKSYPKPTHTELEPNPKPTHTELEPNTNPNFLFFLISTKFRRGNLIPLRVIVFI